MLAVATCNAGRKVHSHGGLQDDPVDNCGGETRDRPRNLIMFRLHIGGAEGSMVVRGEQKRLICILIQNLNMGILHDSTPWVCYGALDAKGSQFKPEKRGKKTTV